MDYGCFIVRNTRFRKDVTWEAFKAMLLEVVEASSVKFLHGLISFNDYIVWKKTLLCEERLNWMWGQFLKFRYTILRCQILERICQKTFQETWVFEHRKGR